MPCLPTMTSFEAPVSAIALRAPPASTTDERRSTMMRRRKPKCDPSHRPLDPHPSLRLRLRPLRGPHNRRHRSSYRRSLALTAGDGKVFASLVAAQEVTLSDALLLREDHWAGPLALPLGPGCGCSKPWLRSGRQLNSWGAVKNGIHDLYPGDGAEARRQDASDGNVNRRTRGCSRRG